MNGVDSMKKERYTIMILDDNLDSTSMLQYALQKIDYVEIVHLMDDPEQALKVLDRQPVDILILDMDMPTMMGWEFANLLNKPQVKLVFTGHREYGFEAQEIGASGYISKSLKFDVLKKAIGDAIRDVDYLLDLTKNNSTFVKVKNFDTKMDEVVRLEKLYYAEVEDKILSLFMDDGRVVNCQMSLSRLMEDLPDNKFVRISAKHMVAVHAVNALSKKKVQVKERKKPLEICYPSAYTTLQLILDMG